MISEEQTQQNLHILADAISKAIGENKGDQRFIDMSKIPLICLSITGIHESLKELKEIMKENNSKFVTHDYFYPYKIAGTAIIVSIVGGLITLLLK